MVKLKRPQPLWGLRKLRVEQGVRQAEIARHLGISQSTYCLIESGTRRTTETERKAIAKLFKVAEAEIFPSVSEAA
jgi:transcriptional regulator with XRE-family HTH domain